MRALAVSSPERLPALPDVPTMRESRHGRRAAELARCRRTAGISPEQEQVLEDLLVDMTRTDAWRETLARRGWGDATLAGPEFEEFVRAEQDRVSQVLDEIGLG